MFTGIFEFLEVADFESQVSRPRNPVTTRVRINLETLFGHDDDDDDVIVIVFRQI